MMETGKETGPIGIISCRGARGFSLVEVLIAAGVMGAILISIAGMFVFGAQNVQGGRNLSAATTQVQSILEEMRGMRADEVYGLLDGQPADSVKTWNTDQANPVYTVANEPNADRYNAILNEWRDAVRAELPNGRVVLTVEGFADRPRNGSDGRTTLGAARFLRVRTTVFWREYRGRGRLVTMELIKF